MERNSKTIQQARLEAWYDSLQNGHPFELQVKSRSAKDAKPFRAISVFPWNGASIKTLWNGDFASEPGKVAQWEQIYKKWSGMVAVGGGSKLRFFLSRPLQQYFPIYTIEVPAERCKDIENDSQSEDEIACVAWCMVHNVDGFWPLVAFSANSILYLYDVEKANYHGVLRGHGGRITSLAVHPSDVSMLASTSYDYTCRIYDLTEKVACKIDNPCWPGKTKMALGGGPFGLRSNEPEGNDYGRCNAILVGGPSGGHLAPVLSAAFHPSYPIIATCGMDCAVKLWRLPATKGDRISREDKPLFSSTTIHDSQVLSIHWISKDMLLSNCGEVIMLKRPDEMSEESEPATIEREPGTLVLWRWLSLERFFPPDREVWHATFRGCASDYQESSSYKVISKYNLPRPQLATGRQLSTRAFVFQSPSHTPLIALPAHGRVHLSSVRHFKPRPPLYLHKILKLDTALSSNSITGASDLAAATDKLNLNSDNRVVGRVVENRELPCWIVEAVDDSKNRSSGNDAGNDEYAEVNLPKLEACALAEDGRLLIAVGENEGIWIWRIPQAKQVRQVPVSVEKGSK